MSKVEDFNISLSDISQLFHRVKCLENKSKNEVQDRLINTREAREILGGVSRATLATYVEKGWLDNRSASGHPKFQLSQVMKLVRGENQ